MWVGKVWVGIALDAGTIVVRHDGLSTRWYEGWLRVCVAIAIASTRLNGVVGFATGSRTFQWFGVVLNCSSQQQQQQCPVLYVTTHCDTPVYLE